MIRRTLYYSAQQIPSACASTPPATSASVAQRRFIRFLLPDKGAHQQLALEVCRLARATEELSSTSLGHRRQTSTFSLETPLRIEISTSTVRAATTFTLERMALPIISSLRAPPATWGLGRRRRTTSFP